MRTGYVIDGRQLAGQMGGVQRYASEILLELDKLVRPGEFEILIPRGSKVEYEFSNIKLVEYGIFKGLLWEQLDFPRYLLLKKRWGIFLCTITSMLYPKGITVIHDVMPKKFPEFEKTMGSFFARKMLLLNYRIAAKHSAKVATVSNVSREDIATLYKINADDIAVIGNAWQHIKRVKSDDGWMNRFPSVKKGEYYFSLSANRIQKNFKWILEAAKRNPDSLFLIAGTQEEWQKTEEINAPNILHLGFVSDEEVRSLMENCKAFIFPSLYEGFGIPPLEALAVGARIIISNTSCLPEVYADSAYYIDPYDYDVDLDKLLMTEVAPAEKCLARHGWDKSAKKLYETCKQLH